MTTAHIKTVTSCADEHDPTELSVDDARQRIFANIVPVTRSEQLPIRSALGYPLAAPVISPVNVPPHINSAMDGYALNGASLPVDGETKSFHLVGTVLAGGVYEHPVGADECVRIMTGAPMPTGADTVIMQEQSEARGDFVRIVSGHKIGQNVRQAGEDLARGDIVLNPGRLLTPADIGILASMGLSEIPVRTPPTVAFFTTGDELRSIGEPLREGEIYDSNRYILHGMLKRLGCRLIDMGVITDEPETLRDAFQSAAERADVVITTGGVSVGEADFIRPMLAELGDISFWKIAIKPGRPLTFGKLGDAVFFGLPGNPVAVAVSFYQFVQPALRYMLTGEQTSPLLINARCKSRLRKRPGRTEFPRAVYSRSVNSEFEVETVGKQGSGILTSMSRANCFIVLPESRGSVEAGEIVTIQPFESLL